MRLLRNISVMAMAMGVLALLPAMAGAVVINEIRIDQPSGDSDEYFELRGDPGEMARWQHSAAQIYAPRRLVFAIDATAAGLPGSLAERRPVEHQTVAYRCVGSHCSLPITSFEALAAELSEAGQEE